MGKHRQRHFHSNGLDLPGLINRLVEKNQHCLLILVMQMDTRTKTRNSFDPGQLLRSIYQHTRIV